MRGERQARALRHQKGVLAPDGEGVAQAIRDHQDRRASGKVVVSLQPLDGRAQHGATPAAHLDSVEQLLGLHVAHVVDAGR